MAALVFIVYNNWNFYKCKRQQHDLKIKKNLKKSYIFIYIKVNKKKTQNVWIAQGKCLEYCKNIKKCNIKLKSRIKLNE